MSPTQGQPSEPMPTVNVIGIVAFACAALAFAAFIIDNYLAALLATEPEIVFAPLGIVGLPVCAVFFLIAYEAYCRNFAKRPPPPWLFTASKYALIAIVAALIAGPLVVGPAIGHHLSASGYVRADEGRAPLDRRLWQSWEKAAPDADVK